MRLAATTLALSLAWALPAPGQPVSREELARRDDWARARFGDPAAPNAPAPAAPASNPPAAPPFSFTIGGKPSAALLPGWPRREETRRIDEARTGRTVVWTDPATHLEVRCAAVEYADYPVVEWTVYFRNAGDRDTPMLADVRAIDAGLERRAEGEFLLHSFAGSSAGPGDYMPRQETLGPKASASLSSRGWSTTGDWPYVNLDWGGEGAVVALGWPGSWSARFERDEARGLRVQGGLARFASYLKPGEEVRSPLAVVMFWKGGDWVRSQNLWRRWMLAHNVPRPGGSLPRPFTYTCVDGMFPGMLSNAADEIRGMDRYLSHGTKLDCWWIDAGWYAANQEWGETGTWEPDPKRYPRGVREVSDRAHERGMKLVLWFEPERVRQGTWLAEKHPEWLLGQGKDRLLNLGDDAARGWVTDRVAALVREQGVDVYRNDYNINPADAWESGDAPGRAGMTEMRYVVGFLGFWDELRRRFPGLLIDTCASGGRRNDLETLRRAVPLLRSDYRFEPNGTQCHNYGLSFWVPFQGTGVEPADPYVMRSHFCPAFGFGGPNDDPNFDYAGRNRVAAEWRQVADNFLGDYYPLTRYSREPDAWMAWQFDRPEAGEGVVQVFRRSESPYESARLPLRGLEPGAEYDVKSLDPESLSRAAGRELMEAGLLVQLPRRASAVTIEYRRRP